MSEALSASAAVSSAPPQSLASTAEEPWALRSRSPHASSRSGDLRAAARLHHRMPCHDMCAVLEGALQDALEKWLTSVPVPEDDGAATHGSLPRDVGRRRYRVAAVRYLVTWSARCV